MKKFWSLWLVFSLVILLAACGGSEGEVKSASGEDSGKVYELNFNNFLPSTHHYATHILEPWAQTVEEKSDGRVRVNLYHGGTLGSATSVAEDVSGGLYEMGIVAISYYGDTAFYPLTIGNLPFAFSDHIIGTEVLTKFADKYGDLSFDVYDQLQYMDTTFATEPFQLLSREKITSAADFKGLTMRVGNDMDAKVVKAWGATPVALTVSEVYEALQKGTVDTNFYGAYGSISQKYYEVTDYVSKIDISVTPMTLVMNKSFYESLPADLQQLFDEELNPALGAMFVDEVTPLMDKSWDLLAEEMEVVALPESEYVKVQAPAEQIWEQWVKDANDKGYPGDDMMADFKQYIEEAGGTLPF